MPFISPDSEGAGASRLALSICAARLRAASIAMIACGAAGLPLSVIGLFVDAASVGVPLALALCALGMIGSVVEAVCGIKGLRAAREPARAGGCVKLAAACIVLALPTHICGWLTSGSFSPVSLCLGIAVPAACVVLARRLAHLASSSPG